MNSEDLVYFIVLLSVTACWRNRLLWPMANKVNDNAIEIKVIDMTTKNKNNNKMNAVISIFININF